MQLQDSVTLDRQYAGADSRLETSLWTKRGWCWPQKGGNYAKRYCSVLLTGQRPLLLYNACRVQYQ